MTKPFDDLRIGAIWVGKNGAKFKKVGEYSYNMLSDKFGIPVVHLVRKKIDGKYQDHVIPGYQEPIKIRTDKGKPYIRGNDMEMEAPAIKRLLKS